MRIFLKDHINRDIKDEYNITDSENIKHIKNVMRRRIGDIIEVVDFNKKAFTSEITSLDPLKIRILEELSSNENNVEIHLYQGLPKFDKMEYIIEKSIELGIDKIYPVELDRSIVKLKEKDETKKIDRWNKISESAAKQSKRNHIPIVNNKIKINDINFSEYDLNLFLDTNANNSIKELNINKSEIKKISIIIGPEGGFSDNEREFLNNNASSIKLGSRILRTETASLAILSVLQYIIGDF